MKNVFLLILISIFFPLRSPAQISVNKSNKFLIDTRTDKPFFWLADTAWELFHRITREDVIYYLDTRTEQGFNVILAVALAENNGLQEPNRYGDVPFVNLDPANWTGTPGNNPDNAQQYDYWDHMDFVIKEASKRNIYIGLLPTWGDKVAHLPGEGPQIFNEDNAYVYAKKLAERYRGQWNIIWILGGDRPTYYEKNGRKYDDRPIWRAMARGIREVYGEDVFITYHPSGATSSSSMFSEKDEWLKMNVIQSGHGSKDFPVWDFIRNDLAKTPLKPTMDMEPCYEDHPVNPWDGRWTRESRGYFSAYDVRARIYRGVFSGGCGATYGHHSIWQFLDTTLYEPINVGDTIINWRQAIQAKEARQIHNIKDLMLSRPDFDRVEDSTLILSDKGKDYIDLIIATRNKEKTYALIYLPQSKPVVIDLSKLRKGKKQVSWFNPQTGEFIPIKNKNYSKTAEFTPPSISQKDWVLVIDVISTK